MERGSSKHGRRLDEAMERETRGLVQAGHETRSEEWLSAEPSGEDQPDVTRGAEGVLGGGVPDGMTAEQLEERAELAGLLGKEIWPAEAQQLQQLIRDENGPDHLQQLVDRLPNGRIYVNLAQVWQDLTGTSETHRF